MSTERREGYDEQVLQEKERRKGIWGDTASAGDGSQESVSLLAGERQLVNV